MPCKRSSLQVQASVLLLLIPLCSWTTAKTQLYQKGLHKAQSDPKAEAKRFLVCIWEFFTRRFLKSCPAGFRASLSRTGYLKRNSTCLIGHPSRYWRLCCHDVATGAASASTGPLPSSCCPYRLACPQASISNTTSAQDLIDPYVMQMGFKMMQGLHHCELRARACTL